MDPIELYHLLGKKPFQPMRVFLTDGRVFDIPDRQMAVVGVDYLNIGIQAAGEILGVCEDIVRIPLTEVLKVDPLVATVPPTGA